MGKTFSAPKEPRLPKNRLQEVLPVTFTGIYFTGALHLKDRTGNIIESIYMIFYTCAATRTIHLEVVTSLTKGSLLQAFRRFFSRKFVPKEKVTDNATTFVLE